MVTRQSTTWRVLTGTRWALRYKYTIENVPGDGLEAGPLLYFPFFSHGGGGYYGTVHFCYVLLSLVAYRFRTIWWHAHFAALFCLQSLSKQFIRPLSPYIFFYDDLLPVTCSIHSSVVPCHRRRRLQKKQRCEGGAGKTHGARHLRRHPDRRHSPHRRPHQGWGVAEL